MSFVVIAKVVVVHRLNKHFRRSIMLGTTCTLSDHPEMTCYEQSIYVPRLFGPVSTKKPIFLQIQLYRFILLLNVVKLFDTLLLSSNANFPEKHHTINYSVAHCRFLELGYFLFFYAQQEYILKSITASGNASRCK